MRNDEWMQLFKPIPKRKADWPALANELQYPVNSVSTSQVAEDSVSLLLALGYENETYPSTMSLQDWSPHEAGAALQKWKKKFARPSVRSASTKEATSKSLGDPGGRPVQGSASATPKRLERTPPTKRGADRDALALPTLRPTPRLAHGDATFNKSYATRDSRRDEPHDRQSRRDRRESDRRRDDYRNTPRVTLADASLDDLLAELEGREATRSGTERSDGEHHAHEDDQDEYDHYQSDDASSDGSLVDNDRHLAAANRVNVAQLLKARTPVRQPSATRKHPDRERGFNQDRRSGERTFNQDRRGGERSFNQDRRGGDRSFGQDSRGRRDFNRDNRRPQYGPCAVCGGMTTLLTTATSVACSASRLMMLVSANSSATSKTWPSSCALKARRRNFP
ncbi:hypothetical protein GQ600_2500 [Phytophthora cactorum]|nr:hypothetical protein GQ600_2500 [Phytophthora cactorum]